MKRVCFPEDTTAFHCSADWHLIRLGKYASPIHALMLRVQGDELDFFGSIGQMAEYFRAGERHVRRALHRLIKSGFVVKIASRSGNSTIYRALTHKQWAELHPAQCAEKRDATGQTSVEFDPSPKGEGVQNSGTKNAPLPEKGSTPLHKRDGHPSPKGVPKSPMKSPNELPKDTDTAMQQKDAAPLDACRRAFNTFCQEMEAETAFNMVLWILYRAASVKNSAQIPQSVDYYREAKKNFTEHHENDWEIIAEDAEKKFCKHAYRLVEAESPDLLAWLKEKALLFAHHTASTAAGAR